MAGCKCENWTLQDLSSALQNMHKDKKNIVVPTFQRGKRWSSTQEKVFIDSLDKGYPVGTMLFYETNDAEQRTYILVDGLQRGNSIKKYMTNPTLFFSDNNISDSECSEILASVNMDYPQYYKLTKDILTNYIKQQITFKNLQFFSVARDLLNGLELPLDNIENIINAINNIFSDKQYKYDKIANTVIPVIVYTGDENTLPEIFDRINSKGTPLDKYEVYAASWPVNEKNHIDNDQIVNYVVEKYKAFVEDGYFIHNFDETTMREEKQLNTFEYLFGLGKYLVDNYEMLAFNKNIAVDSVNPIAFELVNACLNDSDKINLLYKRLRTIDLNKLEHALFNTIAFVEKIISIINKYKGSSKNRILHSKYQILSMISTTFKTMYKDDNYEELSHNWPEDQSILERNLLHYYIFDIITKYWGDGGTTKIHAAAKPNRYLIDIPRKRWELALDEFYETSMTRTEFKKIATPKNEEIVFLNTVYLKILATMEQSDIHNLGIEYLAPKSQLKRILENCNGLGLPISCIANLCYLPNYNSRINKDKNFYLDTNYLEHNNVSLLEDEYTFTTDNIFNWMNLPFNDSEEAYNTLQKIYASYCSDRFDKLKEHFFDALEQDIDDLLIVSENMNDTSYDKDSPSNNITKPQISKRELAEESIRIVAQKHKLSLVRYDWNTYKTPDNEFGYVIQYSKMYDKGGIRSNSFWFAHRENTIQKIADCKNKFVVYCCANTDTIICLPLQVLETLLPKSLESFFSDGTLSHRHVRMYKYNNQIFYILTKPYPHEVNLTEYLI